MKISIKDQIACAKRELAMREKVYPRWVAAGRMSPEKSQKEILAMRAIIETLEEIEKKERLI